MVVEREVDFSCALVVAFSSADDTEEQSVETTLRPRLMWVRLGTLALLALVVCTSVFFIVVSFDCNIVLDRSLTDCYGSHLNQDFAGRVVPILQYGTCHIF